MEKFLRHGDRNIRIIETLGLKAIPEELHPSTHNVVGVGESTHRHRIRGQCVVYDLPTPRKYTIGKRVILIDQFFKILEPAQITHEEHKPKNIEPGDYAIAPEREMDVLEQKIRTVMD